MATKTTGKPAAKAGAKTGKPTPEANGATTAKPWLKSYPPGISRDGASLTPTSLGRDD